MPKKREGEQPGTSNGTQEAVSQPDTIETKSTSSVESLGVPAINFRRYPGTIGVSYIQMGQASHIQNENKWDLEETISQREQIFTTDLKTLAIETTNDENLLNTLLCLERRTLER